jgi:hypothetical protein
METEARTILVRTVACAAVVVLSVGILAGSVTAKAKPTCTSVSPATINRALGTNVVKPTKVTNSTVALCTYRPASGSGQVLIRFESGLTKTSFALVQKSFDNNDQPTQALSGFGDAAFTSTIGTGEFTTNTVVMLKGSNSVLITAGVPLDKVEGLAKIVLKKL